MILGSVTHVVSGAARLVAIHGGVPVLGDLLAQLP